MKPRPLTNCHEQAALHIHEHHGTHGEYPKSIYVHRSVMSELLTCGCAEPGDLCLTFFGIPLLPSLYDNPAIMYSPIDN